MFVGINLREFQINEAGSTKKLHRNDTEDFFLL